MITSEELLKSYRPFFENMTEVEFDKLLKEFGTSQPAMVAYLLEISDNMTEDTSSQFILDHALFIYKMFKEKYANFRMLTPEEIDENWGFEDDEEEISEEEMNEVTDIELDEIEVAVEPEFSWFINEVIMDYFESDVVRLSNDEINKQVENYSDEAAKKFLADKAQEIINNLQNVDDPDMLDSMLFLDNFIEMMDAARIKTPLRIVN